MISHQEAKRLADEHLRAEGASLVARHATRNSRYGVWFVSYVEPGRPAEQLQGGALVVLDDGTVLSLSSVPGSLGALLIELGLREPEGTDAEAMLLDRD